MFGLLDKYWYFKIKKPTKSSKERYIVTTRTKSNSLTGLEKVLIIALFILLSVVGIILIYTIYGEEIIKFISKHHQPTQKQSIYFVGGIISILVFTLVEWLRRFLGIAIVTYIVAYVVISMSPMADFTVPMLNLHINVILAAVSVMIGLIGATFSND